MDPIVAHEGWFVSHLFYRIDYARWESLDSDAQGEWRGKFQETVESISRAPGSQINCYSIWGQKADLAIMIIDPELHSLNESEVGISTSLSPGVLQPVDSFISMSEISEYISQEKDYDKTLREKEGLDPESAAYQKKMGSFRKRIGTYVEERLYPVLPNHKVMCFYPMSKSRGGTDNWYLLDFDSRKRYMAGHAITGRKFQKTVSQLITGSIGLDDWEWGVTLFADDPYFFKKILYEMRYDEASARFGEFGRFYTGIRLDPQDLLERLRL
jgi:chlorite dismutase